MLGTLMLGLLAGHRRYAPITALRGDAVAVQALGMAKVISEDGLLEELGDKRPALVRGESGYDNEGILLVLEGRGQAYLLRLRQAANVQRLVAMQFAWQDWSRLDNQGCQMVEDWLQLQGWKGGFDELKNQWGLSGFTTQDINRCQTTARACALVHNWRSWYCCSAYPTDRMEAITSRPLLLAAVGRAAHSGGQATLCVTPMQGKASLLKPLIANFNAALQHVKAAAQRWRAADPWAIPLRQVNDQIASTLGLFRPPVGLQASG